MLIPTHRNLDDLQGGKPGEHYHLTLEQLQSLVINTLFFQKEITVSTHDPVQIDSFNISDYRSAEYLVQISRGGEFQLRKFLALHNGTEVFVTGYGDVRSDSNLGSFEVSLESSEVRLTFTSSTNAETVVSFARINLNV